MLIAIDGPAGAGKSTVARAVARSLGFQFLDSGAMYRAAALAALRGCDPTRVVVELGDRVVLDGEDVTEAIRTPEVTEMASKVSADPAVRKALVERQREIIAAGDHVAEGRDIGTVVWPGAELKSSSPPRRRSAPGAVPPSSGPIRPRSSPSRASATSAIGHASTRRCCPRRTPSSSTPPAWPSRRSWSASSP